MKSIHDARDCLIELLLGELGWGDTVSERNLLQQNGLKIKVALNCRFLILAEHNGTH